MTIVEIIFPIFTIVLFGYAIVRLNVISVQDANSISRLVFNILIPVFLFNSIAHVELPEQFDWQFFLAYYIVMFIIFGLGMLLSKRFFAYARPERGIFGMGSSYSNLVLIGLPIVTAGFGDQALLPLFMIISIHSGIQFFVVTLVVEGESGEGRRAMQIAVETASKIARNPIIIGLFLGLLANVLNLIFPEPLDNTLELVGRATLPCALLVLGGSLNAYRVAGHFTEAWMMIGLKMVLQPLLVWVMAFQVFQVDPLWGTVAVMAAGMPVGVNAFMAAQKYQVAIATTSTAFLISTLLSPLSQSLLLSYFL